MPRGHALPHAENASREGLFRKLRRSRRPVSRRGGFRAVALIWLIGRGAPWNAKLMTLVVTLAIIVLIVALERGGYWPEAFHRR